jgi:D-proline reductase (dithiol) PrdB
VCVLAHVLEAAGLATVALVSNRVVAEKMHPPRALYGEFPLGRPLGRPGDPAFQRDVLLRAFALLDAPEVPVLVDHPEVIEIDETPLACALPPRYDTSVPAAVDEARALRPAWDRSLERLGLTSVGRVVDADGIPDLVGRLVRIAEGERWDAVDLPGDPVSCAHDVRTYYEEAAVALADDVTGGSAEVWFSEVTEAGRALLEARRRMKEQDAPFAFWFYMAAGVRS